MRNALKLVLFTGASMILLAAACRAQDAAADPAVEPEAIGALEAMSAHLRTLEQFRLVASTMTDVVVEGGQVVEVGGRNLYDVRRPDRFRIEVVNDRSARQFYYDGATVTQFAPALGYYSVFQAAASIGETLDKAANEHGIGVPLADLFYWGTDRSDVEGLTAAFLVGDARISGETCNHYAFRTQVTDFQVWIRKHGDPLPCRLVIVTTDDEARPRFAATLEWDLDPVLGETVFTFSPPPGAEKIVQAKHDKGPDTAPDAN